MKIQLTTFADLQIFENALEEGRYDLQEECAEALEELAEAVEAAHDVGEIAQGAYLYALWCRAYQLCTEVFEKDKTTTCFIF